MPSNPYTLTENDITNLSYFIRDEIYDTFYNIYTDRQENIDPTIGLTGLTGPIGGPGVPGCNIRSKDYDYNKDPSIYCDINTDDVINIINLSDGILKYSNYKITTINDNYHFIFWKNNDYKYKLNLYYCNNLAKCKIYDDIYSLMKGIKDLFKTLDYK